VLLPPADFCGSAGSRDCDWGGTVQPGCSDVLLCGLWRTALWVVVYCSVGCGLGLTSDACLLSQALLQQRPRQLCEGLSSNFAQATRVSGCCSQDLLADELDVGWGWGA